MHRQVQRRTNRRQDLYLVLQCYANLDPAVLNVIREEMPAYFLDQKTLDAVLSIINNRVTTIIKERGGSVSNQTSG